ncbi:unnamed protein product [Clavelina lepadiformis]|uniref:PH domain-containing protein n=1 Tax=Clavelina lepadiformis TaxID=159417 RepID=A0ABP0F2I5_CLALP
MAAVTRSERERWKRAINYTHHHQVPRTPGCIPCDAYADGQFGAHYEYVKDDLSTAISEKNRHCAQVKSSLRRWTVDHTPLLS